MSNIQLCMEQWAGYQQPSNRQLCAQAVGLSGKTVRHASLVALKYFGHRRAHVLSHHVKR
jgi:hypothetical protein